LTLTRDGIYNDFFVSATGSNNASGTNTPVMAEAADNNSASASWIGGAMGDVPNFVSDNLISTSAQALAEAQYDLGVSIASAWTIGVSSPINVLFDLDDVATVTDPYLNLNGLKFIVDSVSTSIRYDAADTISGRVIPSGS
jgi:hypothetical protein